jgi:hypothetical protein
VDQRILVEVTIFTCARPDSRPSVCVRGPDVKPDSVRVAARVERGSRESPPSGHHGVVNRAYNLHRSFLSAAQIPGTPPFIAGLLPCRRQPKAMMNMRGCASTWPNKRTRESFMTRLCGSLGYGSEPPLGPKIRSKHRRLAARHRDRQGPSEIRRHRCHVLRAVDHGRGFKAEPAGVRSS